MTQAESDAIYMAELFEIDARKRAGLHPGDVFCQQIIAIVAKHGRDVAIEARSKSVDNL